MPSIPVGATGQFILHVGEEHLANRFKDSMLPPVLATPVMILAMENAALNAIKPYLAPGMTAVGSRIDVAHLLPTPAGRDVHARAQVTKVDGKRLEFTVSATDGAEEIGKGTHERIVIDIAKFITRLQEKFGADAASVRRP
jgi:fluoroacetyl-CoA thioesterase